MISASQMFPWFGTLKSKEEVVIAIAKVKYEKLAALKLELFFQVKSAFHQLVFLNKKQLVIKENIRIYKSLESIALAKVESGQSSAADVLRIQSKLLALELEFIILGNNRVPYESKINELTKRPLENSVVIDDSIVRPTLEIVDSETYRLKIEKHHPLITQIDYKIETSKRIAELNEDLNKPSLGFGVDYSLVRKRKDANPSFNGRDILVPKVMLSVPIYRKAYHAKGKQEELVQESLYLEKEIVVDRMMNLLVKYRVEHTNARLAEELAIKQKAITNSAYEILIAQYSSSGSGFEELLMVQNQLLAFDLDVYKAKLETSLSLDRIERITNF